MTPIPEQPVPEQPVAEHPVAEQPVPEQPVPEQPVPEHPVPEHPVPEQPVPEQPHTTEEENKEHTPEKTGDHYKDVKQCKFSKLMAIHMQKMFRRICFISSKISIIILFPI